MSWWEVVLSTVGYIVVGYFVFVVCVAIWPKTRTAYDINGPNGVRSHPDLSWLFVLPFWPATIFLALWYSFKWIGPVTTKLVRKLNPALDGEWTT